MIIFETDFSADAQGVKLTGDVLYPFAGSEESFSGVADKFLLQTGGDYDPHGMVVDGPAFMLSGGRRVQTKLSGLFVGEALSEQRMMLNGDHALMLNQTDGWRKYMWQEIKVRPSEEPTFRIMFRLIADGPNNQWGWQCHAATAATDSNPQKFWNDTVWDVPPPLDEWFTMKVYYRAGDLNTGRVVVTMQRDGQEQQIIHDITDWTDHPDAGEIRDAQEWFPQKQYGPTSTFDLVANQGGVLRQHIDWWRFSIPGANPLDTTEPISDDEATTMKLETYWDDATNEWVLTWDGVESRRGPDHSDLLDAEKAQLESDNSVVLGQLSQLDDAILAL